MNMNKKKGMSQTLALIVAASVLMMTALTVIFLAQGSLGSFGQDSAQGACSSALNSKCRAAIQTSAQGSPDIQTPQACIDEDGNALSLEQDPRWVQGGASGVGATSTTCKDASGSTT